MPRVRRQRRPESLGLYRSPVTAETFRLPVTSFATVFGKFPFARSASRINPWLTAKLECRKFRETSLPEHSAQTQGDSLRKANAFTRLCAITSFRQESKLGVWRLLRLLAGCRPTVLTAGSGELLWRFRCEIVCFLTSTLRSTTTGTTSNYKMHHSATVTTTLLRLWPPPTGIWNKKC